MATSSHQVGNFVFEFKDDCMKTHLRSLRRIALAGAATFAAVTLVSTASAQQAPAAPSPTERQAQKVPNIIFVLVDDLRYDAMGFLTPGLRTPHIDFMAKNGVHFPNAVVTSSLCSPSRATILTGQTARNHGVIDNNNSSEEGLIFFPSYLQQAGYQTGFFGKWHMGNDTDAPRQGFDRWVAFKGQGTYLPTDQLPPQAIAAGVRQTLNVDGDQVKRTGYITDELTDYALDWLEKGRDTSKPFFLYLSHKAVHSDTLPAERHANQYADLDIKLPATLADTPESRANKPIWVQNQRNSWHGAEFPYHTDQALPDMIRSYYRTLSSVDDNLGRLLSYLRKAGLEENTVVVFYSDNGFMFGEHGLIDKRNAYQPSVRVPMVVYAPSLLPKGTTNEAVVRNLDLAPTFLDMAGVGKPDQMEGTSWLQMAQGKISSEDGKSSDFVYEYYWEWTFPHTPTTFAIQRDRLKYIQYHGVWDIEELYDLANDPDETRNLIDDPAYAARKMVLRKALFEQLADNRGAHNVPYTERASSGLVWRKEGGTGAGEFPAEWYQEPNLPGKMSGLFADTPAKLEAEQQGKPYFPRGEQ